MRPASIYLFTSRIGSLFMAYYTAEPVREVREMINKKFNTSSFDVFTNDETELIQTLITDYPADPFANMAQGFLLWQTGEIKLASGFLEMARKYSVKTPEIFKGIEIGVNSWYPNLLNNFDGSLDNFIDQEARVPLFFLKSSSKRPSVLTILSSCDGTYFDRFGSGLLLAAERDYSDFSVHLHVINPSAQQREFLASISIENLAITIEEQVTSPHRAYYASRRYQIALDLMDVYDSSLLIADIDVFPAQRFNAIVKIFLQSDIEVSCGRFEKTWMPWNRYIVTKSFFRNTHSSRQVLKYLGCYLDSVYRQVGSYEFLWWIDQNAMYSAIEHGLENDDLKFQPIAKYGQIFLGPEKIGKQVFSDVFQDYAQLTDNTGHFIAPIGPFLDKYRLELLQDVPLLERLLSPVTFANAQTSASWGQYLLALYIVQKLPSKLNDYLLALLFKQRLFALGLSTFNSMRGRNSLVFPKTPMSLFSSSLETDIASLTTSIEYLATLLSRTKLYKTLEVLQSMYSGECNSTLNHFQASSIRNSFEIGDLSAAMSSLAVNFTQTIMVVGLQRSGTNWIAELLRSNTDAYIPYTDDNNNIFWKHAFPDESGRARVNRIFKDPIDALRRLNAYCFVVYKRPENWIDSVKNRNPADLFTTRKARLSKEGSLVQFARFYCDYLNRWRSAMSTYNRIVFLNYEVILANPGSLFDVIPSLKGLSRGVEMPGSLAYSKLFDSSSKSKYLGDTTACGLSGKDISAIRATVRDSSPWLTFEESSG